METIKFKPIWKPTLWGGESWLISAVKGSESVAAGGECAGLDLPSILAKYKAELVGGKVWDKYGETFPLLVKFIDARQDLSIQVHPNDEMAARVHGKLGKNEMWYVVDALKGSCLIDGFRKPLKEADYEAAVADGSIEDYLNKVNVEVGDVFFIPAGRVHGIGGGCYVAEIQQSSDVTYRLYDYNRRDKDGNLRELHTDLARQAITFGETTPDPYSHYDEQPDRLAEVVSCPYFTTSVGHLSQPIVADLGNIDSFVIVMTLDGACSLSTGCGPDVLLAEHEAALVPASAQKLTISPVGKAKILVSHV